MKAQLLSRRDCLATYGHFTGLRTEAVLRAAPGTGALRRFPDAIPARQGEPANQPAPPGAPRLTPVPGR